MYSVDCRPTLAWIAFIAVLAIVVYCYCAKSSGNGSGDAQLLSYGSSLADYRKSVEGLNYETNLFAVLNISTVTAPALYPLGELLESWIPSDVNPLKWLQSRAYPTRGGNGLPRFNYMNPKERSIAMRYRDAEQPFVMYNIPQLHEAASTHFTTANLLKLLGSSKLPIERSISNKFTYYATNKDVSHTKRLFPTWEPPQSALHMEFSEFLSTIKQAGSSEQILGNRGSHPYYYLTLTYTPQNPARYAWIKEALPFFAPAAPTALGADTSMDVPFFTNDTLYRGILCRFGSKGMNSAAHFDGQRNFVAMICGRRRYILLPPSECKNLELYPRSHPSARHSSVDWSNITEVREHPALYGAQATEVVLSMGEILYLPANWFHYIVHQDASIQCNSRSGTATTGDRDIASCGFRRKNKPV